MEEAWSMWTIFNHLFVIVGCFGGMFVLSKMNYGFISYYHVINICGNLCYLKTFNGNQKEESVTRP
jgi:hypothetical protein